MYSLIADAPGYKLVFKFISRIKFKKNGATVQLLPHHIIFLVNYKVASAAS
jgi:hypothetical protein